MTSESEQILSELKEINKTVQFIAKHLRADKERMSSNISAGDEILTEAKKLVVETGVASASFLQRRLLIGYARAARLLDLMEESGVVGPSRGAKPRKVIKST